MINSNELFPGAWVQTGNGYPVKIIQVDESGDCLVMPYNVVRTYPESTRQLFPIPLTDEMVNHSDAISGIGDEYRLVEPFKGGWFITNMTGQIVSNRLNGLHQLQYYFNCQITINPEWLYKNLQIVHQKWQ